MDTTTASTKGGSELPDEQPLDMTTVIKTFAHELAEQQTHLDKECAGILYISAEELYLYDDL